MDAYPLESTRKRRTKFHTEGGVRTANKHEFAVATHFEEQGYTVLKNGWPDFLIVRGNEVRLVEVKPRGSAGLGSRQRKIAEALTKLGLKVEVWTSNA
jgi:hypothetical protein